MIEAAALIGARELQSLNGVDDLLQVLRGQVQILGCHLQILMAEQQLDGAQVRTGFEQMRGPCMANEMRARRLTKAGVPGRLDARQPHRLRSEERRVGKECRS